MAIMAEIIFSAVSAAVMTAVYCHTDHPKMYAFINTAAGLAVLIAESFLSGGTFGYFAAALAAVFGMPGALLHILLGML